VTGVAGLDPGLFDVELPPAPYPGLRPFERHEWPIFFGREPMTQDVITRLLDQNFAVVHGDSGCGKSSLIRAGVLVQLEQQHERGGQTWRTCDMLPREAPLWRLAEALAGLRESKPSQDLIRDVRRALNTSRGAAGKLEELFCADPADRVCILVDQFEELFRFARETNADEAGMFVEILVGLLEEAERRRKEPGLPALRIHAILTMRSEFLGHCARYKGLAEAVNRTQYLLPQMERPALLRAIREPAKRYDGEVSRALAERLMADVGGGQDQLPLIQHGLMQLWGRKTTREMDQQRKQMPYVLAEAAAPFRYESGPLWRLGLEDYRGAGGLAELLSQHADDIMAEACRDAGADEPAPERQKIEHLFRSLTDINAEGSAIRRPQTLAELVAVTGTDEQTLKGIIDRFREEGVSFLRPYGSGEIKPETEIDISHEALIRCWQKIADPNDGWLQREFRDGLIWRSLLVQAEEGGTLSPLATATRDAWLETLPSETWCERYGGGWSDVQALMARSREERARYERREQQAWIGDSYFRAEQARGRLKEGLPVTAMQLALAGLPDDPEDSGVRPWVGETAGALVEAMGVQRELKVLKGHEGFVFAAGFSPDGARIVSGSYDKTVRVWDALRGQQLLALRVHDGEVNAVGFSPDGARIVSGSNDKTVQMTWVPRSKQELIATARARLPRELTEAEKRHFHLTTE
jgi:energy-coupling factor transporter ATP-binding protein EcfA2